MVYTFRSAPSKRRLGFSVSCWTAAPGKGPLPPFPPTTLAATRQRAAEARRKALDGIDPIEARDQQRETRQADAAKARAEAARVMTFKACADAYIKAKADGWRNAKHAQQWLSTFEETKRGSRK